MARRTRLPRTRPAWSAATLSASGSLRRARWHGQRRRARMRGVGAWVRPMSALARVGIAQTRFVSYLVHPRRHGRDTALAREECETRTAEALEELQRAYFAYPWLGQATIGAAGVVGSCAAAIARAGLRAAIGMKIGDSRAHRRRLEAIPKAGYEAFLAALLAGSEAAGVFRSGEIHVRRIGATSWARGDPHVKRAGIPEDLAGSFDDIDDLTWAARAGSLVKVIRVGDETGWRSPLASAFMRLRGCRPRWIVEIAGTDHLSLPTTTNPADPEANIRESLGLVSNQRRGVERAVLDAMEAYDITTDEERAGEDVLLIGHSQGAMVAMALAAAEETPFPVRAVVSAGGPIGRMATPPRTRVLALRHLQDPIPLFGGLAGEVDPAVVVYERSLRAPTSGVLYYAHAAGTYARTAAEAIAYARRIPDSNVGRAIEAISHYYPQRLLWGRESGSVFIYEITQDVLGDDDIKEADHEPQR